MLCYRVRRVDGDTRDREAQSLGCGYVNVVEPGTAECHELHPVSRECLQAGPVELVIDEDADCLRALRQGRGVAGQPEFQEAPLDGPAARCALQRLTIVGFG